MNCCEGGYDAINWSLQSWHTNFLRDEAYTNYVVENLFQVSMNCFVGGSYFSHQSTLPHMTIDLKKRKHKLPAICSRESFSASLACTLYESPPRRRHRLRDTRPPPPTFWRTIQSISWPASTTGSARARGTARECFRPNSLDTEWWFQSLGLIWKAGVATAVFSQHGNSEDCAPNEASEIRSVSSALSSRASRVFWIAVGIDLKWGFPTWTLQCPCQAFSC